MFNSRVPNINQATGTSKQTRRETERGTKIQSEMEIGTIIVARFVRIIVE